MNAGDGLPTAQETPIYVHKLLDALLQHKPIDFDGNRIPDDVRARLEAYFAAKSAKQYEMMASDEVADLIGTLAAGVQDEFGNIISAASDTAWLSAGLGILTKMHCRQVGWYRRLNSQAWMFVQYERYPSMPDDGEQWTPVFAFGE